MTFAFRAAEVAILGAIIGTILAGPTGGLIGAALGFCAGALSAVERVPLRSMRTRRDR